MIGAMLAIPIMAILVMAVVITAAWNSIIKLVPDTKANRMPVFWQGIGLALDLIALAFLVAAMFAMPTMMFLGAIMAIMGIK